MNPLRVEQFVEGIHTRVLNEYIRIINIPISMRKEFSQMLDEFSILVGYDKEKENDHAPLTWPRPAGIGASTMALQAKTTYKFWRYFTSEGKNRLADYNRDHNTRILVIQEKTLRKTDQNRLCLFLRNMIKEKYTQANKSPVDMKIKQGKIELCGVGVFDPVILAKRLNWDYHQWNGLPFEELLDYKIKKDTELGKLPLGPLHLPGLEDDKENESYSEVVNRGMKRSNNSQEALPRKKKP